MPTQAERVNVHSTAIVDPAAELQPGVEIGPYSVVEGDVTIGANTRLGAHVVVHDGSRIGADNVIKTGAVIGMKPQDLKYKGERTELIVGDGNEIGEYSTLSLGTEVGRGVTRIGHRNYLMTMSHVGHDCIVGDEVILTNHVALAGMSIVEDNAVLGGYAGVRQFVRVGRFAMVGAMAKVVADVPPYIVADGQPARPRTVNNVGLTRHGVDRERRSELRAMFRLLFRSKLTLEDAIAAIEAEVAPSEEREHLLRFLGEARRGICR